MTCPRAARYSALSSLPNHYPCTLESRLLACMQDARIKHYPNPSDLEECEYNNRAILKFLRHEHGLTFEYKAMDIVKGASGNGSASLPTCHPATEAPCTLAACLFLLACTLLLWLTHVLACI